MIKAEFYFEGEKITGFTVRGHAGFADSGRDIVCAAVSVLTINTVNAISAFTKDETTCHEDKNGAISLQVRDPSEASCLLLNTMLLGFESIRDEYGKKYIVIKKSQNHKEV